MAINFKSAAAYKAWVAYGHIHGVMNKKKGFQKVRIKGKTHRVAHHNK